MRGSLCVRLSLVFTMLWLVSALQPLRASEAAVHCVTEDGTGINMLVCDSANNSIQSAVDAAAVSGDEIRVAAGTYSGTNTVNIDPGSTDETYTQVVLIKGKSLALYGGYATSDWTTSDPESNLTVIDATQSGRCITIIGSKIETLTVDGFTITGGDYSDLGNPDGENWACRRTGSDCGGGLYARDVTLILRNSVVTDNTAGTTSYSSDGGGIYLWRAQAGSQINKVTVSANDITTVNSEGAGIQIVGGSGLTVTQSTFSGNSCQASGGAIGIFQPNGQILIKDTTFFGNYTATGGYGGAIGAKLIYTDEMALSINRGRFDNNKGTRGACISLTKQGPGMTQVSLSNLIMSTNEAYNMATESCLVYAENVDDFEIMLNHLTISNNDVPTFLYALAPYYPGKQLTASLKNTLIDTVTNAFVGKKPTASGEILINHTNTLTNNVTNLHVSIEGAPTFTAVNTLTGNPLLDSTYHLRPGSPAIDSGVDAGVTTDIDGDSRPQGAGYDIGADEYVGGPGSMPWLMLLVHCDE